MGSVAAPGDPGPSPSRRADPLTVAVGGAVIALAVVVGAVLRARDVPIHAEIAPLYGHTDLHARPVATPAAIAVAVLVLVGAPLAERLRWRPLLVVACALTAAWTTALAAVDGWDRGIVSRLRAPSQFLHDLPGLPGSHELLRTWDDRIPTNAPGMWTTHVAGHPPGALMFFELLDRIGLGGDLRGAFVCIVLGASAVAAVAVTVRELAGEALARRAVPFLVLSPAALWVGVSPEAAILGVSAWGVAVLALARDGRGRVRTTAAVGGGLLMGASLYASYGSVLLGPLVLVVLVPARRWRTLALAVVGVLAVVAVFTLGGFSWWAGYRAVKVRYYDGWGGQRPYAYWVWADLAALLIVLGPAVWVGLRRLAAPSAPNVRLLVGGGLFAVLAATLSGMSKGEVERIWLPFAAWIVVAVVALPGPQLRRWLAVQAATALVVQHTLGLGW